MNGVVTWREVLHQMAIEGMIFGFQDTTALPHLLTRHMGLGGLAQSFDTPLWTLHLEFLGSFLVLFLVLLRAVAQTWVWRSICIALIIAFPASPLCLFVIGHLVAPSLHETTGNRSLRWLYVACLVTGLVLCSGQLFSATIWVTDHLPQWQSGQRTTSFSIQNMIGALLIFLGLSQMPSLRGLFCGPLLQWLGRISFSLYLTHFPLLFTVISMLFLCLLPLVGYAASITLCSAVGLATSLFVAVGFERLVDRPAIRLSRLLGASGTKFLGSPNDAVTSRATVDK
jgi:peptidoglycan/LPS O-acetylase OafA/YrhL